MATFTTNYNLRKPATSDYVEVTTDINANMDTIDTEIKARADDIATHETRLDAIDVQLTGEAETTTYTDLTGIALDAAWSAVSAFHAYRIGRLRFLSFAVTKTGATSTGSASGNITDLTVFTGLPTDWRPAQSAYGIYTQGGVTFGNISLNNSGTLTLQTLHTTGAIASGDTVSGTVAYYV